MSRGERGRERKREEERERERETDRSLIMRSAVMGNGRQLRVGTLLTTPYHTRTYTAEPLYKALRTPLYSGHCLGSQLDRAVYKTTPKMKTPHTKGVCVREVLLHL